ncbi:MAG: hypothetical protein IJ588_05935 [Prevotella sp.]|nr:hypothetical protein [Prevotella sp.]
MNKTALMLCMLAYHANTLPLQAQESAYRYADATQLWRLTDNAAGLGQDNSQNRGYAEFTLEHREGDYRRVQEGGQRNQLTFQTERYQKIGMYLVGYGRFRFDMDRTKDRAWCDVMRPYNSDPFFGGSSVRGKYDTQDFDLTAAISTIPIPLASEGGDRELTLGMKIDYQVGDLSRLRDPRSRSELLDYKLTPAVTYTFGRHTLGLSGFYDRRKEKIPNITTVQTDPNLMYWQMTGMEQATGIVGGYGGYNREWVNHQFGAELNYGYQADGLNSLTSVSIARGAENIWGTYKYEPGKYTSYQYRVNSYNRIRSGSLLHQVDLAMNFTEGYADEYRQQLIQERDAEHGYTSYHYETLIEFRKRYQVKTLDADIHYRASAVSGTDINGYAGLRFGVGSTKNKHLLPLSDLQYDHFDFTLEGGKALLKNSLWLDLTGTYHLAKNVEMNLADPTTEYAQQVLLPDMEYYRANYWRGHLELKYQFPLTIKKTKSLWYVKAYGDNLRTDRTACGHLDSKTVGLSVGLYN